ncbi:MAG: hypothetical protein V7641_2796 [Blastocatellia bacterium]
MVSDQWSVVSRLARVVSRRLEPRRQPVSRCRARRFSVHLLLAVCAMVVLTLTVMAQNSVATSSVTGWSFNYKFENKRFYVPMMEIDLAADGAGELRFQRGESDDLLDHKFKLMPATMARIRQLFDTTRFLDSSDTYQADKDFSHLGWVTLLARQNGRERKVRFNYTQQPQISELADIFRGIATEEMHLFDIETSEQFQPLDLPRLLDAIENDLRLQRITEPERLLAKLQEVAVNPTQPLIARNHATRMVSDIKKGKFKSTMRK